MTKLLLSLLVVPLLTACPKLDELNRTLNGEPPKPATTSTSTPVYIVECNDNTRHILDKAEWDRINIGDTN